MGKAASCLGSVSSAAPKQGAQASSLPLPFIDLLPHMASPPLDPAKKSDNKAIGAWGEEQGQAGCREARLFVIRHIRAPPLCVPSVFELHVAEGVKITKVQSLDFKSQI